MDNPVETGSVSIRCDRDTKRRLQMLAAHYQVPDQRMLQMAVEHLWKIELPAIKAALASEPE